MEVGGEGDYVPISVYCHHQNDSCIKVGSDESHRSGNYSAVLCFRADLLRSSCVRLSSECVTVAHSAFWIPTETAAFNYYSRIPLT